MTACAESSACWYVLHTHPGAERKVWRWLDRVGESEAYPRRFDAMVVRDYRSGLNLRRDGYELWLPERIERYQIRRTFATRRHPLFPGYVFIRLDLAHDEVRSLENVEGVDRLLRHEQVSPQEIERRIAGIEEVCLAEPGLFDVGKVGRVNWGKVKKDSPLRVLDGPFASFPALYSASDEDRIKAMIDIFGRLTPVWLDKAQVELVSAVAS